MCVQRSTYSKQSDSSHNAPVILAHDGLVCAGREVRLGDGTASFDGFRGHDCNCTRREQVRSPTGPDDAHLIYLSVRE